jgi:hypothetical protein
MVWWAFTRLAFITCKLPCLSFRPTPWIDPFTDVLPETVESVTWLHGCTVQVARILDGYRLLPSNSVAIPYLMPDRALQVNSQPGHLRFVS